MEIPFSDRLETGKLARIFDSTTESYKFFWFGAVLDRIISGSDHAVFSELVDDMIARAWYMVSEYHLSLGPADTMEKLILELQDTCPQKSSEKKDVIISYLEENESRELRKRKLTLIKEVPFRLQSTLLSLTSSEWQKGSAEKIRLINSHDGLIYTFSEYKGLDTVIWFDAGWSEYIRSNAAFLDGWYRYCLINYLQRRNPDVPGIPLKISPPEARNLTDVTAFWKNVMEIQPVRDIYSGKILTSGDISIDHFIPWSYTASDEFWNLDPTTRSINSSKSNCLPEWDTHFPALCTLEYSVFTLINRYPILREAFEKTARNHFSSDKLKNTLFGSAFMPGEKFRNVLSEALEPQYQAAVRCGFSSWSYGNYK